MVMIDSLLIGFGKQKPKSISWSRLWDSSPKRCIITGIHDRWPLLLLFYWPRCPLPSDSAFIWFKLNSVQASPSQSPSHRSCHGCPTDGESPKVKTTTFQKNSQTSIANTLFRLITIFKLKIDYKYFHFQNWTSTPHTGKKKNLMTSIFPLTSTLTLIEIKDDQAFKHHIELTLRIS